MQNQIRVKISKKTKLYLWEEYISIIEKKVMESDDDELLGKLIEINRRRYYKYYDEWQKQIYEEFK